MAQAERVTSAAKLAEFKAATRDRSMHPEKINRLWEEFVELVEQESNEKAAGANER